MSGLEYTPDASTGHVLRTQAPRDYDYGSTEHLGAVDFNGIDGKPIRVVLVGAGEPHERAEYLRDYQAGRYQSGLYATWTVEQWAEQAEYLEQQAIERAG